MRTRTAIISGLASAAVLGLVVTPFVEAGQEAPLPRNSVGTDQIRAGAVTRGKIRNGNVVREKIAAAAVARPQIARNAVGAGQLADGTVGSAKLAPLPGAALSASANQSVPPGGTLAVVFNQVRFNQGNVFNPATPTRLTAPVDGVYIATGTVAWSLLGDQTSRRLEIRRSGGPVITQDIRTDVNASVRVIHTVTEVTPLRRGEFIELFASSASASGLEIVPIGELSPEFQLQYLSPLA